MNKKRYLILITILIALLAGSSLIVVSKTQLAAEVNINSITPIRPLKSPEVDRIKVRLVSVGSIVLDPFPKDGYISQVKFDREGNIYLSHNSGKGGKVRLLKFNAGGERQWEVDLGILLGEGALFDFDVDEDGQLYGAYEWPNFTGALIMLSSTGELVTKIDTPNFVPFKLAVDTRGNMWVVGSSGFSVLRRFSGEFQMRVYEPTGKLLAVPAGGFKDEEAILGVFLVEDAHVKFVTHLSRVTYEFAGAKLRAAFAYPFVTSPSVKSEFAIRGLSRLGEMTLWYGVREDENYKGAFTRAFIGLTAATGEAVTREIELPSEYRSLAGIDREGTMYFYSWDGFIKAKAIVDGAY